jgi:lipoprotein NlpD
MRSTVVLAVAAFALGACAGRTSAPVTDRGVSARQPDAEFRQVVAGDTLYSIAWESGRDYRELAAWNEIAPPYTIKPGQRIRLHAPAVAAQAPTPAPKVAASVHTVRRGETLFSIAARYDVTVRDICAWNGIAPPYTIVPGQTLRLVAPAAPKPDSKRDESKSVRAQPPPAVVAPRPATPAVSAATAVTAWSWPTEGKVLSRFSSGTSKGIDIAGKAGQTIVAAAPGTVVYQGSGLRGYGQLIIVKHNTDFLSAYAHCDRIVVREGNVIQRGQKIAEMGSTGTDRVKLHFEIRYRGNPVDPLDHLPKK